MWPFRRRAANASTPGDDPDGGDVLRPARADWRTVEPLRPAQAMPLSTIDRGFEQSLATRARPLFVDSLTHHVHPTAPAGVVDGLAAATRPGLAEGAVRTFVAPAVAAQRITSVEDVAMPPAAPLAADPAPAVQRTAVANATPAPPAPPASQTTADAAGHATPLRSPDAQPHEEPAPAPAPASDADDQEQPRSTPDEIVERPLLSERAPLPTTTADDSAPTAGSDAAAAGSALPSAPVQRRVDLSTPATPRPAMRIGPPQPPSTDRTAVGSRDHGLDGRSKPATEVQRTTSSERLATPRLGAPAAPDQVLQRTIADGPSPDSVVAHEPAAGRDDGPADVAAGIEPVISSDASVIDAVRGDAPLVGETAIGTPAATAPPPAPGPAEPARPTTPSVGGSAPAVQRTVFDTPVSARPAAPMSTADPAPAAVPAARSIAAPQTGTPGHDRSAAVGDAPLVGAAAPLVDVPTPAGPGAEASAPVPAAPASAAESLAVVARTPADESARAEPSVRTFDSGLLGDRPATLTVDWPDASALDRTDGSARTEAGPTGTTTRTDIASRTSSPSSLPVVSRASIERPAQAVAASPSGSPAGATSWPSRPPVLHFGPPPTSAPALRAFEPEPEATAAHAAEVATYEMPVSLQRQVFGDDAVDVQRAGVATTSTPARAGMASTAAAPEAGPTAGRSEAEVLELARVLYPQLQRRLARDLLLDRERAGYRTDIRF